MNIVLTLTFCFTLSITEAFLLPRELKNEDPETAQEELEFLMTLAQAFESHPKFVDLLVSWMKSKPSKPVSEELDFGAFTQEAWMRMKIRLG